MGGVRPVVAGAVVVLLIGAAALLLYVERTDDGDWQSVGIHDAAFADDRESILVLADEYRSASCTEHRVTADRDGTEWAVRLEARKVEEGCTLEGCLVGATTIDALVGGGEPVPGAGCPPIHALELDEPAPADVVLVADG